MDLVPPSSCCCYFDSKALPRCATTPVDEVVNPVLLTHIVERADVRVVQATDGIGLALEAFPALRVGGEMLGEDFGG